MAHIQEVPRKTRGSRRGRGGRALVVYRVRYRDLNRVERSKTFERKVDAERFAAEITSDIGRGDYLDPRAGQVVLEKWVTKWLSTLSVKPKTRASYESLLRSRVLPAFGRRRLDNIRPSDIQGWVSAMHDEGLSASRIRQAVIVLRLVMDAAVQDRLVARNPCDRIKAPRLRQEEAAYFDPATIERILGEIDDQYQLLFRVLAVLGLRWGEAAALRRRHVDLLKRRIRVEDSLAEVSGKLIFGSTKSHAVRTVPIPPSIAAALTRHLKTVDNSPDSLLFRGPKGGPIRYRYAYMSLWRPALERLGLPAVGLHTLRHSAAARLISAGATPKAVQTLLGHRSAAFTLNVYGHVFETDLDALGELLDS
ncbi:MAG: site-specific integrase [Actinomycetota bacterium]|nr:site-specific integrase [Actinomycetota bacterium]